MEDNEVLDFESELEAFEKEWQDEETVETEPEAGQEAEEVEQEEQPAEEQTNPNDPDAEKRNAAFAQLRRQAEENRKYAEFIQRLAEEGGVSPDDLLSRYEERKLQTEAEKQNVPVDVLKRLHSLESESTQAREALRAERFNAQVEAVSSKYGAAEEDIRAAMQEMMESGIDPRTNDNFNFEKFYRAANLDKIIQQETEKAVQKSLEDKRKRQENASIGNGNSVSPPNTSDWSDEDFDAELKRLDIRL
jgi:hypothetical protein